MLAPTANRRFYNATQVESPTAPRSRLAASNHQLGCEPLAMVEDGKLRRMPISTIIALCQAICTAPYCSPGTQTTFSGTLVADRLYRDRINFGDRQAPFHGLGDFASAAKASRGPDDGSAGL